MTDTEPRGEPEGHRYSWAVRHRGHGEPIPAPRRTDRHVTGLHVTGLRRQVTGLRCADLHPHADALSGLWL